MYCADGYEGPLCSVCRPRFGRGFRGLCQQCEATEFAVLELAVLFIAFWAVLTLTLVVLIQNWRAPTARIGQAMVAYQSLVLYMQTVSLLEFLNLNWAVSLRNFFSLLGTIADFRLNAIEAANCIFSAAGMQRPDVAILYSCFLLFIPLVALSAKLLVTIRPTIFMSREALAQRRKHAARAKASGKTGVLYVKEHQRKTLLMIAGQIVVFFIFQSAAYNAFEIFPCVEVQMSAVLTKQYLAADMSVDCDSNSYAGYRWFATVMAFVFALIIPVGSFFFVGWMKHIYDEDYYHLYAGFMILGLRRDIFFWQSLVYVRKMVLILIIVFLDYPLDSYLFVWFLTAFVGFQWFLKPFESGRHNLLDGLSLLSILVIGNLGLLYNIVSDPVWLDTLTYTLLIVQSCTCCGFLVELLRLLIWLPFQERKAVRHRDAELEIEEDTTQMKSRLEMEERPTTHAAPKEDGKSFSALMETRRLREEGSVRRDMSTTMSKAPQPQPVGGDKPLTRTALLPADADTAVDLPRVRAALSSPVAEPPVVERVEAEGETLTAERLRVPRLDRSEFEGLHRDIDRFLGENSAPAPSPLARRRTSSRLSPQRTTSKTQIVRPVELEAKHNAYLASLKAERDEYSSWFVERHFGSNPTVPPPAFVDDL